MTGQLNQDTRVALAEIRGDVKLILAGQERTHSDIATINKRLELHDGRIGSLETDRSVRDGERKSISIGGKILGWGIGLFVGTGVGAAISEVLR